MFLCLEMRQILEEKAPISAQLDHTICTLALDPSPNKVTKTYIHTQPILKQTRFKHYDTANEEADKNRG